MIRIEPALTPNHLITDDGAVLPLRTWMPVGDTQAVIVALHGFNDYSNAFAVPGERWAAGGIATYAFDQRGFGEAPYRGRWAGTDRMARDAALAVRLVERRHPALPVYLLGESMGGAIALAAMTGAEPPAVAGLILVAPAARGRAALGPLASGTLWLADHILPWYPVTADGLNIRPSDNIPMLRAFSADPQVIKATRIDTIYGLVDLMDQAVTAAPQIRVPTLVLYGRHEEVVSTGAARALIENLPRPPAPIRIALYQNGYHMLLRDHDAQLPIADIAAWIAAPAGPLPSGADGSAAAAFAEPASSVP